MNFIFAYQTKIYLTLCLQAGSIGRCDKTVREFLEQNYKPEVVTTDKGAVKLAVRALLEVQSGARNLDVSSVFIWDKVGSDV